MSQKPALVHLAIGTILFSLGMAVLVGAIVSGNPNGGFTGGAIGGFFLAIASVYLGVAVRKFDS